MLNKLKLKEVINGIRKAGGKSKKIDPNIPLIDTKYKFWYSVTSKIAKAFSFSWFTYWYKESAIQLIMELIF